MKRTIFPFFVSFILVFFVIASSYADNKEKILEFPYSENLFDLKTNNYFCKAIVGSKMEVVSEDVLQLKKGVRGKLFPGTDQIAIEIENDKLHLLTRASFEIGVTEDENPLSIIYNDENQLVAVGTREHEPSDNIFVDVFSLNKKKGIAIWSKSRSNEFMTKSPDVQSYCFKCEPR